MQLQSFQKTHNVLEIFQTGFNSLHSTKTAFLKAFNILLAIDSGESAVIFLLDLTAAFDTVDHSILISWLQQ